jgi:hypothetical protein
MQLRVTIFSCKIRDGVAASGNGGFLCRPSALACWPETGPATGPAQACTGVRLCYSGPCSGCSASTQDSLTPTQPQLRLKQEQLSSLNGKGKCLCANWDVVNPVIPPQSAHLNPCCSRDPAPLWLRSAPQVCWPLLRPGSTSAQVCSGLFTLAHQSQMYPLEIVKF